MAVALRNGHESFHFVRNGSESFLGRTGTNSFKGVFTTKGPLSRPYSNW